MNDYISSNGLLEESDKGENVAVTVAATAFCLKIIPYNVLSSVTYWHSYQKKAVKRSVQCHVFAQLPKEGLKRSVQ